MQKTTLILWIVLAFAVQKVTAQDAPFTIAETIVSYGTTVVVPIKANGFNNIGSCNLKLIYDSSILIATAVSKGPLLTGTLASNIATPGVITLGWFTYPGVTLPDETVIFTISFTKVSFGTSSLTWIDDGYSCAWSDGNFNYLNDSPTSEYYIDGSSAILSFNAPVTITPDIVAVPNTLISVPVTVSGFNNIGALSLAMNYNSSVLAFQSYTNNSGLPGLTVNGATPGTITVTGLIAPGGSGFTLSDNSTLVTLQFNYLGGSTGLIWFDNESSCEYKNYPTYTILNDSPYGDYYINGSVSETGIRLGLKVFLEGAYRTGEMITELNNQDLVPLDQPYSGSPWNYNGLESVASIPADAVDWVLVDLRETSGDASTATANKSIAKRAAFIMKDGSIKDLDGMNNLEFSVSLSENLYIVIYHRNHLAVISVASVSIISGNGNYDFSSGEFQVLGGSDGHKELAPGVWGMIAGDSNGDGNINDMDKQNYWDLNVGRRGYFPSDFSMDSQIDNKDKNEFWDPNYGFITWVP